MPASIQVPIFLKILTFDRNFDNRVKSRLKIAIVYVEEDPASQRAGKEIASALDSYTDKTIKKLPISYVLTRYTTEQKMMDLVKSQEIDVFYLAPGTSKHLAAFLRISREYQIITMTGVPEYVAKGVAVGLDLGDDNKPRILINLTSAKLEGVVFDANLLRLATLLQ